MTRRQAIKRKALGIHRWYRMWTSIAKGLLTTGHPLLAHVIPMRRCNLSCAYCNEYDDFSQPVPKEEMFRRIDRLAGFGTAIITISGGEPLLHPDLDELIRRIRSHGIICGLITNGYLLTAERIERLNRAKLEYLQISIDNVIPDEISKKSLKVLDKKLELLAEHAEFQVNINSVIGDGIRNPEDAVVVARRAVELGFTSTLGILHDHNGQLRPIGERERAVFNIVKGFGKRWYARFDKFQYNMMEGRPNKWSCRSGSRYLYICENGLVHYCSQQRGYPAIPLMEYTREHLRREFDTEKPCAPRCTLSCVQQIGIVDNWRWWRPQKLKAFQPVPASEPLVELGAVLNEEQ